MFTQASWRVVRVKNGQEARCFALCQASADIGPQVAGKVQMEGEAIKKHPF
ncbi:MAG: hypothetical protein J6R08_01375 [Opitutales bacterium]|nr:hypothetical protein [Opitutales bacterium]